LKPKSVWLLGWDTAFSRTVGRYRRVPVSELKLILAREALVEIAGMTVEVGKFRPKASGQRNT